MFDKFGEFDSAEELNRAAAGQKNEGDLEALIVLAIENGLDKEDAEDYMNGEVDCLATPMQAALGKLKIETDSLKLQGILLEWKDTVVEMCIEEREMAAAVRQKRKNLKSCMSNILRFAFENKVQVSEEVVKATKVNHNGKEEQLRGPLYIGIPNRSQVRDIIRKYYELEG